MSWDKGFDFRGTSGWVTDPANCTYVLLASTYPTTRNSVTFGWLDALSNTKDIAGIYDARLKGSALHNAATRFQIDLPAAGTYSVTLAVGDEFARNGQKVTILDNVTALFSENHNTASTHAFDSNGLDWDFTVWPASETTRLAVFASTTMIVKMDNTAADFWGLAHVFVSQVAAAAQFNLVRP